MSCQRTQYVTNMETVARWMIVTREISRVKYLGQIAESNLSEKGREGQRENGRENGTELEDQQYAHGIPTRSRQTQS